MYLLLLFVIVILLLCEYIYNRHVFNEIPGFTVLPIIGNSLNYILSPVQLFTFLRQLPKIFGYSINEAHVGNFRVVNLYNPEDIEKILSSVSRISKNIPYKFLEPWLGEGLLTSNGMKWQQRRKLLTGAFHFNILKQYSRTFTEQCEHFLEKVEIEADKDMTDLVPLISKTTLHIMCETAMGTSMSIGLKAVIEKYFKAICVFGECIVRRFCRVWLYFDIIFAFTTTALKQNRTVKDLHTVTDIIIQERKQWLNENRSRKKDGLAMIDLLLEKEKEKYIDMQGIRDEVNTFLFEGHDTTAMAFSFMIMRIANEPDAQNKLYDEMQRIFGDSDRLPSTEDLNNMKYLDCCIKESLRLYPSVPFIARYLTEEIELSTYKVPANTICNIHIYDLHHRADLYPDPERFVPERFLPINRNQRNPYAYLPFSAGPRNCIGQKFAMLEIKTVMSGLLRKYRIEPVTKPSDLIFCADLVLRVTHPMYVRFRRRFN